MEKKLSLKVPSNPLIIVRRFGLVGWFLLFIFGLPLLKSCMSTPTITVRPSTVDLADLRFDNLVYHNMEFDVINIVDGDTLDIDALDGDKEFTRIRLIGIDTPETKHPRIPVMYYGPEATRYVSAMAGGKKVTIVLDPTKPTRGKYGRLLAYVYLPDNSCLNEELLLNGFAYAYLPYRHQHSDFYLALQLQAMDQKKGLWQNVTQSQLPKWLQPTLQLKKDSEN